MSDPKPTRRHLLATLGTIGIAGLTGCASVLGQDTPCSVPATTDLESLFPEEDDEFQYFLEPESGFGSDPVKEETRAAYDGPNDVYGYVIRLYETPADAREAAQADRLLSTEVFSKEVYIVLGRYLFVVGTPSGDTDTMYDLLARSPALTEGCVSQYAEANTVDSDP